MEQKIITDDIRIELRKVFPSEAYSKHPTKTYLTTLKAMYVTERLNDVFGIGRWTLKHEVIKEQEDQVLIKGKLVFLEYDINLTEQYGSHAITGKGVDLADGYKSAITDCISKSASYLEIGIDMFKGKIAPPNNTTTTTQTTNKKDPEKWLNVYTGKDNGIFTKEFINAWQAIHVKDKKIADIRKAYKVSKETAFFLEKTDLTFKTDTDGTKN